MTSATSRRYGEPVTIGLSLLGGIRTVLVGAMWALGIALLPLVIAMLIVSMSPLDYELRSLVDAIGRGFLGYWLVVMLAGAVLLPAVGLAEGALMRREIARRPVLLVMGPALQIAQRRASGPVLAFSGFGIVLGVIGIITAIVLLFTDPSDTEFTLVTLLICVVISVASWFGSRWALRADKRAGATDKRAGATDKYRSMAVHRRGSTASKQGADAARSPRTVEPNENDEKRPPLAQFFWVAGLFLVDSGGLMLPSVLVFAGHCEQQGPSCEQAGLGISGFGIALGALVVGVVIVLIVIVGDSRRQNVRVAELKRGAQSGKEQLVLPRVLSALEQSHPFELGAGVLAGLVAIVIGVASAAWWTSSVFGNPAIAQLFATEWIAPALVALVVVAAVGDWWGARSRDRLLRLVNPAGPGHDWP